MPLTRSQGGCAGCCKMPETQLQETFKRHLGGRGKKVADAESDFMKILLEGSN